MPAKSMCAAASYAALRASATVSPTPTTSRMRPPFVTSRPSWSAVPAWKTSAPVASAASTPSIGVPWSPRSGYRAAGDHDRHRGSVRNLRLRREVAREQRQQVALEPGQQRLRLGIAEAAVELDHPQPVVRSHQSRVEESLERRAALHELAEHRQVHPLEYLARLVVRDVGQRREGAHAARVRPGVAVPDPLVVAGRREGDCGLAGGDGEERSSGPSRSSSPWKGRSDACAASSAESSSSWVRQTQTPLPAASPSSLRTHGGRATGSVRAVGTPAASITSLAKDFEPSIRAAAALGPKTAMPRWRSSSARPATRGASGPTTTRSIRSSRASETSAAWSSARAGWQWASAAIPGLPGAACSSSRPPLRERDQASACSRPPDPTTSALTRGSYDTAFEVAATRAGSRHERSRTQPARLGERVGVARGRSPHRSGPGPARARPARDADARGERVRGDRPGCGRRRGAGSHCRVHLGARCSGGGRARRRGALAGRRRIRDQRLPRRVRPPRRDPRHRATSGRQRPKRPDRRVTLRP